MIDFSLPDSEGYILTCCHSPWMRLFVNWCRENKIAIMIVSGAWIERAADVCKNGKGLIEVRHIIEHLHNGGRIVIASDVFGGNHCCTTRFLDKTVSLSLTPARLAALAKQPLIVTIPRLDHGKIIIHEDIRLPAPKNKEEITEVMQRIVQYIETEIKKTPAVWSPFIKQPVSSFAG